MHLQHPCQTPEFTRTEGSFSYQGVSKGGLGTRQSEPIFGEGMRRSTFQWKKGLFSEKGGGNSVNEGFGKDFYKEGIQWRAPGHSVNRRTLKTEKLLSSSPSRKLALVELSKLTQVMLSQHVLDFDASILGVQWEVFFLVDVSDIFYFFCSGRGRGSPRRREGGVGFYGKSQEGGVSGGGGPEGPEGCLRRIGDFFLGGGPKYFFSGPKRPPSLV